MHNYIPIKSKPFHCVPACLEIIFMAINISVSQEYLGEKIGIDSSSNKDLSLGAKIELDNLNKIIQSIGLIGYIFTYIKSVELQEWMFEEKIEELLKGDNHVICTLSAGKLHNNSADFELGHAVIVRKIETGIAEIIDPGPKGFGSKEITLQHLYLASRYREGGLLILGKKSTQQLKLNI
ncbi:MAG: hypothetical protein KDI50_01805 [Candidatus Competibacteraceae bacterium]|nr:hypothetical protein [Candidatus Competibacteraceae bacterium]